MGDLTTLATAKEWLSVKSTTDDALLTRLITAVSAAAQQRMGRQIAQVSYSVTKNGNGKSVLSFPDQPVTAVSLVSIDGTVVPARSGASGQGYVFGPQLLYLVGYTFTSGVQNILLNYTAGYLTTPSDLEEAVLEIVGFKYKNKDRIGLSSQTLASQVTGFQSDVPADALRIIDQYRRVFEA